MSSAVSPSPLPASATAPRLEEVDGLRGFALLGILVVNSAAFASPYFGSGIVDPAFSTPLDSAVRFLTATLFESKFYLLFSFLFGYSFTLQLASARRADRPHHPAFLRRLTLLLALGIAHACLLYPGDILTIYALMGLLLIPLQHLSPRRCLLLAVTLITALSTAVAGLGVLDHWAGTPPTDPVETADAVANTLTHYRAGLLSTIRFNVEEWSENVWLFLLLYQGPHALAMFLLGLAAGQKGLLESGVVSDRILWRTVIACGPIGFAGGLALALTEEISPGAGLGTIITGLTDLTAPSLTATYAAGLLLILRRFPGGWLVRGMAAAGRMALSNYLTQSVICSLVFTGYGLALSGSVSPLFTLLFAFAVYGGQLAVSRLWLRHYQQGPAECLLRAFTHWQAPRLPRITHHAPGG